MINLFCNSEQFKRSILIYQGYPDFYKILVTLAIFLKQFFYYHIIIFTNLLGRKEYWSLLITEALAVLLGQSSNSPLT